MTDVSRRKFVAAGGAAWASTALAGCTGGGGGDGDDTTEPATDSPTDTQTDTQTPEPQPENFVVTDDILAGSAGTAPAGAGGFADSCSWTRTFTHGMEPIFKVGVYDPETGDQLGSDEISVAINIEGGPSADLVWSQDDDPEADPEWSGPVWEQIPDDWDTGEATYTVEVTDNDGNFRHVGIASGTFEVVEYDDPANNYVVTVDYFRTSTHGTAEDGHTQSCSPTNTFAPGSEVGFDVGIWSGDGSIVGANDDVVNEVLVSFPDLEEEDSELGWNTNDDGEPIASEDWEVGEHGWAATWAVPDDVTEDITYEVQISGVDDDEEFSQVGIYRNNLQIV